MPRKQRPDSRQAETSLYGPVNIADFERDVVETNGACFSCFNHGVILWLS
jgi:hypothetical protein